MTHAVPVRSRKPRYETLETRLTMSATVGTAAWFDANLHNAAIRNLVKADYQDNVLGRSDMIAILRQVEKSGLASAEFTDLKTIVNAAALFAGVDYVRVLSRDVVLGNPANAHYQGSSLGNLKAGFSAAKMEKLVDKWFFGTDHPKGTSDWGPTFSYRQASGQLFVGGVVVHRREPRRLGRLLLPGVAGGSGAARSQRHHQHVHRQRRRHLHRAILPRHESRIRDRRYHVADRFGRIPGVRRHGTQSQQCQQRTCGSSWPKKPTCK